MATRPEQLREEHNRPEVSRHHLGVVVRVVLAGGRPVPGDEPGGAEDAVEAVHEVPHFLHDRRGERADLKDLGLNCQLLEPL
eukprot:COSAG03_NODE_10471_length_649_cov_0.950909_3_plen_81_part_01